MQTYQKLFIEEAIAVEALRFGEFTLKSGRKSPYFFNAGIFNTGKSLTLLGQCYAAAIEEAHISYQMLFGPAYKGIPLVCTTAIALNLQYQLDIPYAFNRKEIKNHGEGGNVVGHPLQGNIIIIDDVITAGTAIRESIALIKSNNATPTAIVIAIDRQEKGNHELSAVQEIAQDFQIQVIPIIKLAQLIEFLAQNTQFKQHLPSLLAYQLKYGSS